MTYQPHNSPDPPSQMFNLVLNVPDDMPPWMPAALLYIFIVFHRSIGGFGISFFR